MARVGAGVSVKGEPVCSRRAASPTPLALVLLLQFVLSCMTTVPPGPEDDTVVVRLHDLQRLGYDVPEAWFGHEHLSRTAWIDGSIEIENEFDPPEDASAGFYLYSAADLTASPADSAVLFRAIGVGARLGARGVEMDSDSDWLRLGADSQVRIARDDGVPYLLELRAWEGRRVWTLIVAGYVLHDEEAWKTLIKDKFARLSRLPR